MAQITSTEANIVIPEIWDQEVLQARYAKGVVSNKVLVKTPLVTNKGDMIHIPIRPRFTSGAVGTDGSFTPVAQTYTEVNIVINTWQQVSIEVKDDTEQTAMLNLSDDLASQFGEALIEKVDTDLLALDTNFVTNVLGTPDSPVTFDDTVALAAFLKLRKINVPKEDLFFVLPPESFYSGLLLNARFTDADKLGLSKSVVLTGDITHPIFGAPGYESNLLATRGSAKAGFLMHKEAMGAAYPINHRTEKVRRTAGLILSTVTIMHEFYGVITGRENHACKIFVKTT